MSGSISDLAKNRALAEWLEYSLCQTRNRIRELEIQEQQEQRRRERARAEQSWKIQPKRTGDTAMQRDDGWDDNASAGLT
ncbi:hypothetical protein ABZV15_23830 [Streptomyces sp. NPDC005246]|uniref:hypothetical protein n=1 Tax=Streptomyces sp. NPDC005246 TaxID=3156716 RepID=UPI0033A8D55E